jgi:hypothetical protein
MIHPLFRNAIAAVILLTAGTVGALDKTAFARSLESEQDWYRAIGVWKEVQFENADTPVFWAAGQSILSDLWAARQYEEGLKELTYWEPRWETVPALRKSALEWTGLFQYSLQRFPAAEYSLRQSADPLYLGLLLARTGREADAGAQWRGLNMPDPTVPLEDSRSPILAAAFSAVLPGSGQAYTGHWFDAAQAFTLVGFFGWSTYASWEYDSHASHGYLLTGISAAITALFYVSNIYGAHQTADFYNQNKKNARYLVWEDEVWKRGLPSLSPSTEK